jgi:hypothetical protein
MSSIRISKIKARRGTNAQRKLVILEQGELVYTTDTERFYVGNGVTVGGKCVGMKMHNPLINYYSLSSEISEIGDVVKAGNTYYQLTGSDYSNINSWSPILLSVNSTFFTYDTSKRLTLNTNSISASYINSSTVLSGIKIVNGILQSDLNTKSLEISANKISIKIGGIDEREINSSTFINGISGGSNNKIGLNVDPLKFQLDSNVLKISSLPTSYSGGLVFNASTSNLSLTASSNFGYTNGVLSLTSLPSTFFGSGLGYNTTTSVLSTNLTSVTGALSSSPTGEISIKSDGASGTNEWPKITVDQYGRVVANTSSIYGVLTGSSSSGNNNISNSLSAIFNGTPTHSITGPIPGLQLTKFTAISSNGSSSVVINLSSAGFITFEGNTTTRTGQSIGRFAIPIFAY